MTDVFISYSHKNEDFIRELVNFLKSSGITIRFDKEDRLAGDKWEDVIEDVIHSANIFLTCLSSSVDSKREFFHTEQKVAHEAAMRVPSGEIFIMPVRLDDFALPRELRQYHVLHLGAPDGPKALIRSLTSVLESEFIVSKEACSHILEVLRMHTGWEGASLDTLVATFIKRLRSPAENVKVIEQIANSANETLASCAALPPP